MDNNFKNPFELDEEDTMIKLDSNPSSTPTINNQIGFNPATQTNFFGQSSPNPPNTAGVKDGSMFDLLDPPTSQAEGGSG